MLCRGFGASLAETHIGNGSTLLRFVATNSLFSIVYFRYQASFTRIEVKRDISKSPQMTSYLFDII